MGSPSYGLPIFIRSLCYFRSPLYGGPYDGRRYLFVIVEDDTAFAFLPVLELSSFCI